MDFLEGYKLATRHAKALIDSADLAAGVGHFGIACSLNILAAEEAVKAVFLVSKHYNDRITVNDLEEIFRDHKIKHKHLKSFVVLKDVIDKMLANRLQAIQPTIDYLNGLPDFYKELRKDRYTVVNGEIARYNDMLANKLDVDAMVNWLSQANTDKNRGFYLNKTDSGWLPPKDIPESKFRTERAYSVAILKFVVDMEITFRISANLNLPDSK